jgi:uncharacterized membrane protein
VKTGYSLGKMEERGRIMAEENVIVVSFEEEAKAYQAASVLRQADADGRIDVHAVAIVQRMEDGTLRVKEGEVDDFPAATWTATALGAATGGIIGLTLGVLGGPLGVLLGGTYGMLLGSLVDLSAVEEEESVLATMARAIQPGTTAVIAEVTEPRPEVVDEEMENLGGIVLRRPVAEVEAELVAAADAARAAEEEARRRLVSEKHNEEQKENGEQKGKVGEKIERLKAKLAGR